MNYKFTPNQKKRQPTPEQKAKAEERRARLTEVWQKIADLTEEERQRMIEQMPIVTTCEGHALSGKNTLLLAAQLATVTVVGGYRQWQQYGRQVRKGESSLGLWIPKTKEKDPDAEPKPEEKEHPFFFFGSVFDVTQTDPIEATNE